MEQGVSIITATGNRPEAFELCAEFIRRQDYKGPLQWIVVDDGEIATGIDDLPASILLSHVYPEPKWKPGENTLARNLLAAIPEVCYDFVVFAEDDDWYARDYVSGQAKYLAEGFKIVGEVPARYYHLPTRQCWRDLHNRSHASLAQTVIHRDLLPMLAAICEDAAAPQFIDVRLWEAFQGRRAFHGGRRSVGMKGLPGRVGIGIGHRPDHGGEWEPDPDLETLADWVGAEDAKLYRTRFKALLRAGGYKTPTPTPPTRPSAPKGARNGIPGAFGESESVREMISAGFLPPTTDSAHESVLPSQTEFEEFYFMGQRRYKCNQMWEGGAPCEYDTYDFQGIVFHSQQPHNRTGSAAPRKIVRQSPILNSNGKSFTVDETPPEFADYQFKKD
jgi:hypothetical protein